MLQGRSPSYQSGPERPHSLLPALGSSAPLGPLVPKRQQARLFPFLGEKLSLERWCGRLAGPSWEGQVQPTLATSPSSVTGQAWN